MRASYANIGLLVFGTLSLVSAGCSQAGRYRGDPYYRNRTYDSGRLRGPYNADVIDRAIGDLDRAGGYGYSGRHRLRELDRARADLLRFREQWSRGHFDRDRLDNAIGNIRRLVNSGYLPPREHEILSRDLYALQNFRSTRGYGYR